MRHHGSRDRTTGYPIHHFRGNERRPSARRAISCLIFQSSRQSGPSASLTEIPTSPRPNGDPHMNPTDETAPCDTLVMRVKGTEIPTNQRLCARAALFELSQTNALRVIERLKDGRSILRSPSHIMWSDYLIQVNVRFHNRKSLCIQDSGRSLE
jgi:hypothetical protein